MKSNFKKTPETGGDAAEIGCGIENLRPCSHINGYDNLRPCSQINGYDKLRKKA